MYKLLIDILKRTKPLMDSAESGVRISRSKATTVKSFQYKHEVQFNGTMKASIDTLIPALINNLQFRFSELKPEKESGLRELKSIAFSLNFTNFKSPSMGVEIFWGERFDIFGLSVVKKLSTEHISTIIKNKLLESTYGSTSIDMKGLKVWDYLIEDVLEINNQYKYDLQKLCNHLVLSDECTPQYLRMRLDLGNYYGDYELPIWNVHDGDASSLLKNKILNSNFTREVTLEQRKLLQPHFKEKQGKEPYQL
ncbi:hypothetical protein EAG18_07265 [Pseudoalteromonas sp. J010]|uniref:hypothetical protein n=1 Tax=Pseudoalteromonas sp. J010 TaxID=998465 RepID=UPI000F653EB2|nr:hypothetical protein [Pseudoalteromonas sp. J010]RRS09235.1 hypothetical protein EAG18_07265 [Pseudoalteromonas sp. J010]